MAQKPLLRGEVRAVSPFGTLVTWTSHALNTAINIPHVVYLDSRFPLLHPRKRRTRAPVLTGGFGGGARGCGFEERAGADARTEGGRFL